MATTNNNYNEGLHPYSDDGYIEGVDDPYTIAADIEAGHYSDEERVFPDDFEESGVYDLDLVAAISPNTRYLKVWVNRDLDGYNKGIQLVDGGLDDAEVFEAIKQIVEYYDLDVESVCDYINTPMHTGDAP